LLQELVCLDLEVRWLRFARDSSSPPLLLEDYVRRLPELGGLATLPLELAGEEYRVRTRWGDGPGHDEYLARFGRQGDVAEVLGRIDRELATEGEDIRESTCPTGSEPKAVVSDGAPDPRAPLAYDDYLLRRLIGSGGMGKVYYAWQQSLERPVAAKFLRKSFLENPAAVERFIAEARTVARLRHPGIVGVHGLGRTPGGGYFFVMDWVDGTDLARVVRESGPVSEVDAVRWMIAACGAVEEAHRHGVVHCDLKPGNLLLGRDGRVRVTDFGLARSQDQDTHAEEAVEGTASFMAPEQVARHWGPISEETDVYGLGAVLYTLLTGRPPWLGRTLPDVLAQVVSATPVLPPDELRPRLPALLSEVCRHCLAKPPSERYPTIRELRRALEGCVGTSAGH
jgi:serine/threonine protein kinase